MIRGNEKFLSQIYALSDFICVQFAFLIAWWIRFESIFATNENHLPFSTYLLWSLFYGAITVGIGYLVAFYSPKRKKRFAYELYKIFQIHAIGLLIFLSILFMTKEVDFSRSYLAIYVTAIIFVVSTFRYFVKVSLRSLRRKGFNKKYVLILGAGTLGRRFYDNLLGHPEMGFEVIGFLDDYKQQHPNKYKDYKPIIGKVDDLEIILDRYIIDEVIIALPLNAYKKYRKIINTCEKAGIRALIIPDFYDYLPSTPYFDNFAGIPLINVRDVPLDELRNRCLKRAFDLVFSVLAIIITSPVMLLIAVGIRLTSKGPIIFKQERMGMNRRTFIMYKFRTMKVMPQQDSDTIWTRENDPRRTKFGTFLRKTSLDELPQFFNVLKGDMSIVGPRPERPYFVEQFKEEIPKYMVKHHIRPGITGWAQANGLRGDTSIRERIKHDIFYIENWTLLFDIKIIIKTIINGFINRNAY